MKLSAGVRLRRWRRRRLRLTNSERQVLQNVSCHNFLTDAHLLQAGLPLLSTRKKTCHGLITPLS